MGRRVLIIGAGGLGSPAALALAEASRDLVAGLTLVDPDEVELSNLHRQLLHGEADLGRPKVESGRDALRRRAPDLSVAALRLRLGPEEADALIGAHDVVLEGSDSLPTKFLVSDTAVRLGVPTVMGGVLRFAGQVLTVLPGTACYRCLFEEPPKEAPRCQDAGVLGPACGVIGALQATEVLRLCRGQRPRFAGAVLVCDLRASSYRRVALRRRPDCPACGEYAKKIT